MPAEIAVVIVSHRTRTQTLRLLDSLARDPDRERWDVIVIDNDSKDGTVDGLREYPWARVIENVPQRGFAGAVNQGVRATNAPIVVALNPDTIVPAGTFRRLAGVLASDARIAAVGPLIR